MSQRRHRKRNRAPQKPQGSDLWRSTPAVDLPEPIEPARDPRALLRSLGPPPLPGHQSVGEHYLAAVVERSAHVAVALAAAADLLDDEPKA